MDQFGNISLNVPAAGASGAAGAAGTVQMAGAGGAFVASHIDDGITTAGKVSISENLQVLGNVVAQTTLGSSITTCTMGPTGLSNTNGNFTIQPASAFIVQSGAGFSLLSFFSGGVSIGAPIASDPGVGNVSIPNLVTEGIASVTAATTIAPTTSYVNLTGATAIATITLPSNVGAAIGTTITFFPASTVATTTAGNILAVYSLVGGKSYQAAWNGTKWVFSGSGI